MNILFIYPTIFNPIRGGVERVTDILAREFKNRGHNIFYLTNYKNEDLLNYTFPAQVDFFPSELYTDKINYDFYTQYLNRNHIDIVINQCGTFSDSQLYNSVKGTSAKVVSVIHFNPSLCYNYLFSQVSQLRNPSSIEKLKRCARIAIYPKIKRNYIQRRKNHYHWLLTPGNTDVVALLSDSFKPELLELADSKPNIPIFAIPNPLAYKIEKGLEKGKTILYVGRLDVGQKRVDRLIKIWRKIAPIFPEWQLKVIGDGPDRFKIEKMASKCENIQMLGFQDPEPYYREASILCMTSNFEGFGMVLIEAMSKGCVPIAFNSFAALHDIIDDERLKVTPFSEKEYIAKLSALMNNPVLLSQLQARCYSNVEKFNIHRICDHWESLFNMLKPN